MSSTGKTRLKLTNGYDINFDHIAQLLSTSGADSRSRIPASEFVAQTGLSNKHSLCLCRISGAMGLLADVSYLITQIGNVVLKHDHFCDDIGTLWFLHYVAASDKRNTIWYRLSFNMVTEDCFTRKQFREQFNDLRDNFATSTFANMVSKETSSLLDAYVNQNFARLAYIREDGEQYTLGYREAVPPFVLAACIVRYRDKHRPGDTSLSIADLLNAPNSPGVVCQIPEARLRAGLEVLKTQPGFSLESRADLDQVRLTDAISDYQWLERYYIDRR